MRRPIQSHDKAMLEAVMFESAGRIRFHSEAMLNTASHRSSPTFGRARKPQDRSATPSER
jgi:hypothetical protein